MIIPSKYQWSRDNDPDNSQRINNITKKYITCIKKFGSSYANNKLISNKDNQGYSFQKKILDWFFTLSFIDRLKVSTINNKWVFQTLHQLYVEQKKKKELKFIPRFSQNKREKSFFSDNPIHFLNYFAISSENYELINGYNEKSEEEFLNEIIFIYPDLTKTSKIKNSKTNEDLKYLMKYHYPLLTLSELILNNKQIFENYFKNLSNNNYFVMPPEITDSNKQRENNINDINNISNSFNSLNPLNNLIKNYNNANTENINTNNNYNKSQNMIDLPFWAKQPANSKLCFSINELFLAFFEQNIVVYYILYSYDKQFYNSLIDDNYNKNLEEFITLKKELKDFLFINKENFLNLLNIDIITKEIYYNPNVEKFVSIKKYQNNLTANTKFWKENISYEEQYNLIKEFFYGYNNDDKSMVRLINDISMYNIEQIYSYEDFFLNKVLFNLNKKYENNKGEDLIFDLTNNSQKNNKKKKKRNKKKKKKQENEDNDNFNISNNDNKTEDIKDIKVLKNDNINNNEDKNIEIKKFISIEEDEELRKIKKGYAKLNSDENNLGDSSGSENNCDSKPLLPSDDFTQIMKDKENKYNSDENDKNNKEDDDENENKNRINIKDDNNILDEKSKNNNKDNQNSINIIDNEEDKKEEEINKQNEIEKKSKEPKNEIIESENDNKNIQENKNNINNSKKKKGNNFFLYPTVKKTANDKANKPPFIMKLNEDILSYNKYLLTILDSLSPIKENIIETIKSHIKKCFFNENFFYQIEVYGSYKSHLDIVCSDIDMVFIPQKTKNIDICDLILKLSNHFSSLNKYYKVTPIYTASIPLIKLMIKYENYLEENKNLLDNYSKLINSSIYKNYPYDNEKEISFINIDISFPVNYNNKKNKNAPFHQIEFIRESLSKYIEASIVVRIIKRALKLTDMNNSYKGGLSSYTIFLLVISYMIHINKGNNSNNKHKSNSYGHAFHDVIKYFSKFDFYLNIIDIDNKDGNIYIKRNKKYSSAEFENIPIILDPVTGLNAGKSSFRINDVQNVFISLNEELENLRKIYDKNNNNKNKDNKENNNDKEKENNLDNLIITLLKNVEKKYLNK